MAKKIYISPSNQRSNTYATGGTNEMAQCDKIATEASGAVDPANYDKEIGIQICMERIINKLWELEGYYLAKKITESEEE